MNLSRLLLSTINPMIKTTSSQTDWTLKYQHPEIKHVWNNIAICLKISLYGSVDLYVREHSFTYSKQTCTCFYPGMRWFLPRRYYAAMWIPIIIDPVKQLKSPLLMLTTLIICYFHMFIKFLTIIHQSITACKIITKYWIGIFYLHA